jgi:hypothetical protein
MFESQAVPLAISAWVCTEFNAAAVYANATASSAYKCLGKLPSRHFASAEKNFLDVECGNEAATLAASCGFAEILDQTANW